MPSHQILGHNPTNSDELRRFFENKVKADEIRARIAMKSQAKVQAKPNPGPTKSKDPNAAAAAPSNIGSANERNRVN